MSDKRSTAAPPRHVAIIMDGNGRWARRRALPRQAGHRAGLKPVRMTVERCVELGIGTLTVFAFSSENWERPADEVRGLMSLFVEALEREVEELHANGVRLRFIGERAVLDPRLCAATEAAERRTADNVRLDLVVAVHVQRNEAVAEAGDLVRAVWRPVQSGAAEDEDALRARAADGDLVDVFGLSYLHRVTPDGGLRVREAP